MSPLSGRKGSHTILRSGSTGMGTTSVSVKPQLARSSAISSVTLVLRFLLWIRTTLTSLEIRGKVVRIEEDPDLHFLNALTKRYLGRDAYPLHQPEVEHFVLVVQPERITRPLSKP